MRGTLRSPIPSAGWPRIIPADAGNTALNTRPDESPEDHPRGCGEHFAIGSEDRTATGSSPRMRGTLPENHGLITMTGIIPADAGNTSAIRQSSYHAPDHPRGCGEHLLIGDTTSLDLGSSPRMRGTRVVAPSAHRAHRIIPADAGNTMPAAVSSSWSWDHPRGCGEHVVMSPSFSPFSGSSPRMRGTLFLQIGSYLIKRIIPADAGNTLADRVMRGEFGDHPRGCGEHALGYNYLAVTAGSSPRMRGTPCPVPSTPSPWGIIPADAGNTKEQMKQHAGVKDHPRGCGEHSTGSCDCGWPWGSSPRMRGTPTM